ncbi:MAG: retropepsin-like domain-containing protein [Acidobacteriota bacterium]|nr:retropepsin-like domain-containing protein [Acidobacteriota bacterium]
MSHQLTFSIKNFFRTTEVGLAIPVGLERNHLSTFREAKIDTGSHYCLFQREVADDLEIEVLDGYPFYLTTLAGGFTAYAHTVVLDTFGIRFESTVMFIPAYGTTRNILGRKGWLENLNMALTMDDEAIYLSSLSSNENL